MSVYEVQDEEGLHQGYFRSMINAEAESRKHKNSIIRTYEDESNFLNGSCQDDKKEN